MSYNNFIVNLFVTASKEKYRYPYKGSISTEDLWDLKTHELDCVYKNLKELLKNEEQIDGLLHANDNSAAILISNKIEIVKHIFNSKMNEINLRKAEAANAAARQQLMELIASKKNEALANLSIEELEAKLKELE